MFAQNFVGAGWLTVIVSLESGGSCRDSLNFLFRLALAFLPVGSDGCSGLVLFSDCELVLCWVPLCLSPKRLFPCIWAVHFQTRSCQTWGQTLSQRWWWCVCRTNIHKFVWKEESNFGVKIIDSFLDFPSTFLFS